MKQDKVLSKVDESNCITVARLTIENFSCIKKLEIEFKRLTVFIGEQASGKSVTCKLFYFFTQAVRKVFAASLRENLTFKKFSKKLEEEFHLIFPETTWESDSFKISWMDNCISITISHKRSAKNVKINCDDYAERYNNALEELNKKRNSRRRTNWLEEDIGIRVWPQDFISKEVDRLNLPVVDYIPAGRSFFSTIQENVFALLSDNIGIDYFLKEFGRKIENRRFRYWRYNADYSLREYENILHGSYSYDGKEQWIERDRSHKVRLADASSGQQEVIPLLLILNNLLQNNVIRQRRVVIEEPEAHLFPTAQKDIIELLRKLLSRTSTLGFIITTHSPFILCCLNNLIAKTKSMGDSVSAYHLYDGVCDDLYNGDLKLINAERFDNISIDIANDFS